MKIKEIIFEDIININDIFDDNKGLGAVPDNLNVDYKGFRAMMLPSNFLNLARKTDLFKSKDLIKKHISEGGKIGHPFLIIRIPYEWEKNNFKKIAKVIGHEGRNRMMAIMEIFGDVPVEVHFFAPKYRKHDFKKEWLEKIKKSLESEDGIIIKNPVIEVIY